MTNASLLALLGLATLSSLAFSHPCPDKFRTKQELSGKPMLGWETYTDAQRNHLLESVDFYDGHPKEMAQLVPDNGDSKNDPTWTFPAPKRSEIWQVCRYTHTPLALIKKLPAGTKKCAVKFSKTVSSQVDSITCE